MTKPVPGKGISQETGIPVLNKPITSTTTVNFSTNNLINNSTNTLVSPISPPVNSQINPSTIISTTQTSSTSFAPQVLSPIYTNFNFRNNAFIDGYYFALMKNIDRDLKINPFSYQFIDVELHDIVILRLYNDGFFFTKNHTTGSTIITRHIPK